MSDPDDPFDGEDDPFEDGGGTDSDGEDGRTDSDGQDEQERPPGSRGKGKGKDAPGGKGKGRGEQKPSSATMVDGLFKSHIGHLARGLSAVAEANGGEGKQFKRADSGLCEVIEGLREMREGAK